MSDRSITGAACLLIAATLLPAGPAAADAIDGNWCFRDGRRISIEGPAVVTPGGRHMEGDYDRHAFAYVVPAGESGAGLRVSMVQIDEETIHVSMRPGAPTQTWHRCGAPTS